ncbi:hypothetical protein SOVF_010490 [Spinacia oleracea]|nr:hypothetical protein SOVF_010490 [Spinacia oleracea]
MKVTSVRSSGGDLVQEEGWVVCRVFKKKNHLKTLEINPINKTSSISLESHSSSISMLDSPCDHLHHLGHDRDRDHDHDHDDQGALEQIFQIMGAKSQNNNNNNNITTKSSSQNQFERYMKLPNLESPNNNNSSTLLVASYYQTENDLVSMAKTETTDPNNHDTVFNTEAAGLMSDWATLDRLVATHLNSTQTTTTDTIMHYHEHDHDQLPPLRSSSSTSSSGDHKIYHTTLDNENEMIDHLWSFATTARTTSPSISLGIDPLCHVSDNGI